MEKLPSITDAFVKFYGEEYERLIFERMGNLYLNVYCDPEKMNEYILLNGLEKDETICFIFFFFLI